MTKKSLKPQTGGKRHDARPEFDDAMMAELKQWALGYWLAVYMREQPDQPVEEVKRKAQAAVERDPVTLGFFLPREERERLLAEGLDHFQIETYTILGCLLPCRCRRGLWRRV